MTQVGIFPWSRPMPHNHGSIGQGGVVPLTSITGHIKAPHDALAINADQVDGEEAAAIVTGARVNPVITKAAIDALAINADQVDGEEAAAIVTGARVNPVITKAAIDALAILHSSTSGRTANDHHAQAHNLNTHATRNHADLLNIPANQHVVLPNTIAAVLNNHTKAVHDALALGLSTLTFDRGCRAYRNGSQLIPDAVLTQILFNVENYDVGANFASSQYTTPSNGYYFIGTNVHWQSISASIYYELYIYSNGVKVASKKELTDAAGNRSQNLFTILYLTAGQVVNIRVFQDSGTGKNILGGTDLSFVNIFKLGV